MMRISQLLFVLGLTSLAMPLMADATKGAWHTVPVFNQAPLEVKIGTYSEGANPDLLFAVLWNDGNNNRLDAVRIPAPYDGTGITSTSLENTATLFALGDICTDGMNVVVPYIKDFNLEVSRYNGNSWSQSTVPGTTTNNFDNADCSQTSDGMFLSTHDLTDSKTEIYQSTNAGGSYTFYGRYTSSGPFDGAIREPYASNFDDRTLMGLNQLPNGQVRVTHTSTAGPSPNFNHTPIELLAPPNGFTFVKEGGARFNGAGVTFTYNSQGTARVVEFPEAGPFSVVERDLGPINNTGSQFTFQGGAVFTFFDMDNEPVTTKALWGDYWFFDSFNGAAPTAVDPTFPLSGIGGPVDVCQLELTGEYTQETNLVVGGPRIGSDGTDLRMRQVGVDSVFKDGFESGDTTAWFATCP